MTYKDQFVAEVKCRGKILRVTDDVVRLPFGSEYSLYLKNLSSRKASVNISIDGEDVLDNNSLILEPNSSVELEGFLRGTTARNKFKFINKTKEIQEHRGDKIDDGIIRIEFAYERQHPIRLLVEDIEHHHHHHHHHHHNFRHWNYGDWFVGDSTVRYSTSGDGVHAMSIKNSDTVGATQNAFYSSNVTVESLGVGQPLSDEGITVKGSECNQDFRYASIGELEQAEVIIIRLKGITGSQPIQQPITVDTKLTCKTCGRVSKSSAKFCSNCGTFLE